MNVGNIRVEIMIPSTHHPLSLIPHTSTNISRKIPEPSYTRAHIPTGHGRFPNPLCRSKLAFCPLKAFSQLWSNQDTCLAPIHPWSWSLKVSTWFSTVRFFSKALTSSTFSSPDGSTTMGIVICLASSGSTKAGCTSPAATKGVPSLAIKDTIYVGQALLANPLSSAHNFFSKKIHLPSLPSNGPISPTFRCLRLSHSGLWEHREFSPK